MSEKDRHLLERSKKGEIEAFEELVSEYQKKVFNIALRVIGNHDDASELAQEVFIRIYKSLNSFKEQSALSTWIYRITMNVCLDELRKRKNKKIVYIDEQIKLEDNELQRQLVDEKPLPEAIAEQNELRRSIKEAIGLLSEEHREVVVLRDIQGFSYDEIAKILKCPEGTVKSRINRARQALKEILEKKQELMREHYVKQ